MRKLILKMSISVDGFVGGPNGEIDWLLNTTDENAIAWLLDTVWQAGVHIMGSRTFYDMAAYWPFSQEALAAPMNEIPKVVFSRSGISKNVTEELTTRALKDAGVYRKAHGVQYNSNSSYTDSWIHPVVASGDLVKEIMQLKEQPGNHILAHGGARFAQSLVNSGLVDEYRLLVHPVILGKGLPLFSTLAKQLDLRLVNTSVFKWGAVANVYRPFEK